MYTLYIGRMLRYFWNEIETGVGKPAKGCCVGWNGVYF